MSELRSETVVKQSKGNMVRSLWWQKVIECHDTSAESRRLSKDLMWLCWPSWTIEYDSENL
jgi:hypothetical protein